MTSIRLFVGNMPLHCSENELKSAFSPYGDIVKVDIKSKPDAGNENKSFAFVTLSTSEQRIDSCLKHFSNEDFKGNRLYVTKARESFLERLQREREQAQKKEHSEPTENDLVQKKSTYDQTRNNKRKFFNDDDDFKLSFKNKTPRQDKSEKHNFINNTKSDDTLNNNKFSPGEKKNESEKKRLESMKRKRQEFKEKKMIIKTGLTGIDNIPNKKIIFSDNEDENEQTVPKTNKKPMLFDEDGSGDEINFEIKEQFEGKKGQKVLDLQSRYKSDSRFVLDERFAEDSNEEDGESKDNNDIELNQADEKSKQLNILQDVLGVSIKQKSQEPGNKVKTKLGMLRFDPLQPEHAKFLAPVEQKQETVKKSKKKKAKEVEVTEPEPIKEVEKVEVSKDQFYEVSDVLKEAITQPTEFSLRSLFSKSESQEATEHEEQEAQSIPLETKAKKVKNPLDPGEKNPFVYDSSESEDEDTKQEVPVTNEKTEVKAVWRENLFFSQFDNRLKDGLEFFSKSSDGKVQKERRQLKSVMKKRLYNKERKNKMFQKKIGGRKKTMKKSYRKK